MIDRKKRVHFFGKGYCEKCMGKSNEEKGRQEGVIAKLNANNFCQRKLFWNTPVYHVLCDKRTVIRGKLWEKGEELKGGRGRYEARRVKGAVSIITCNLAASATHHLVSVVPRIQITVSKKIPFLIRVESLCAQSYYFTRLIYKFV